MNPRRSLVFSLATLIWACNQPFEPKGSFDEKPVVFCLVSTSSPTALARVYSTYDPPGFDPYQQKEDTPILDASVSISDGSSVLIFRDTLLERGDTTRYATRIKAFVVSPIRVEFDRTYILSVMSPSRGSISATTVVPGHGQIEVVNLFMLNAPGRYTEQSILVISRLSPNAFGFIVRALIEFVYDDGGVQRKGTREVPIDYARIDNGQFRDPIYPTLKRRTTESTVSTGESTTFPVTNFSIEASLIHIKHPTATISRVLFILTQAEQNLYSYYSIANAFQDPHSMRLDRPDYSSIPNGVGVFGAFAVDSAIHLNNGGL